MQDHSLVGITILKIHFASHTEEELSLIVTCYKNPIFKQDRHAVVAARRIFHSLQQQNVHLSSDLIALIFSFLPSYTINYFLMEKSRKSHPPLWRRYEYENDNQKTIVIKHSCLSSNQSLEINNHQYFIYHLFFKSSIDNALLKSLARIEDEGEQKFEKFLNTKEALPDDVIKFTTNQYDENLIDLHHNLTGNKRLEYSQCFWKKTGNFSVTEIPVHKNFLQYLKELFYSNIFYHAEYPFIIIKNILVDRSRIDLYFLDDVKKDKNQYNPCYSFLIDKETTIHKIKNLTLVTKTKESLFITYKIKKKEKLIPLISTTIDKKTTSTDPFSIIEPAKQRLLIDTLNPTKQHKPEPQIEPAKQRLLIDTLNPTKQHKPEPQKIILNQFVQLLQLKLLMLFNNLITMIKNFKNSYFN